MADIISAPTGIKKPKFDYQNVQEYMKQEEEYIQKVSETAKMLSKSKSKYIGKIIKIPHADSYAMYVVLNLKPAKLIIIETGDAWHSPMAEMMTAKHIKKNIDNRKELEKNIF